MGNLLRGVVVLSLASSAAWAQSPDVYMELHGTRLDATVIGAPLMPANKVQLYESKDAHALVDPSALVPYAEGVEPMAIMFVMSGQEIWTGNDTFETDDNARYVGALISIEHGIDTLDLVHRLPRGSRAGIVTYATGPKLRMPMSPIGQLHGSSFGTQRDYYNQIGDDMVAGITLGMSQLEHTTASRKLLIVIGDGNDTNSDVAAVQLAQLKKEAAQQGIHVFAITYKSAVSDDHNDITRFAPLAKSVSSATSIGTELLAIIDRTTNIFYVSFDVRSLPVFDGKDHDMILRLGFDDADPVTVEFPAHPHHRSWWSSWWRGAWLQLLVGLGGVGLLALLSRRFAR